MVAARYATGMLALLCFVIVFARMTADAVLILGTVFFVAWLATFGVFTWAFWFGDTNASARLAAVDAEIDFEDAVLADLDSLGQEGDPRV